jgi:hypothetical protein
MNLKRKNTNLLTVKRNVKVKSQAWWNMHQLPALGRLKQEDRDYE